MALASRGLRETDSGIAAVTDPDERARLRARGRRVQVRAAVTAAALTALSLFLPEGVG